MGKRLLRLLTLAVFGYALTGMGSLLNLAAISVNHGTMPVWCINDSIKFSIYLDPTNHSIMTKYSRYIILDDILPFPTITPNGVEVEEVQSIGDEFIFIGYPTFFFGSIGFLLYLFWALLATFISRRYNERPSGSGSGT